MLEGSAGRSLIAFQIFQTRHRCISHPSFGLTSALTAQSIPSRVAARCDARAQHEAMTDNEGRQFGWGCVVHGEESTQRWSWAAQKQKGKDLRFSRYTPFDRCKRCREGNASYAAVYQEFRLVNCRRFMSLHSPGPVAILRSPCML